MEKRAQKYEIMPVTSKHLSAFFAGAGLPAPFRPPPPCPTPCTPPAGRASGRAGRAVRKVEPCGRQRACSLKAASSLKYCIFAPQ